MGLLRHDHYIWAILDALISLLLGIPCSYSCCPLPQTKALNYLHLLNVYLLLVRKGLL